MKYFDKAELWGRACIAGAILLVAVADALTEGRLGRAASAAASRRR